MANIEHIESNELGLSVRGKINNVIDKTNSIDIDSLLNSIASKISSDALNTILANYYLKTQTYSRTEVNDIIAALHNFEPKVVASISEVTNSGYIYLILDENNTGTNNSYDEYLFINGEAELVGNLITTIDLSNYVTSSQLTTALADYVTSTAFTTAINNLIANSIQNILSQTPIGGITFNATKPTPASSGYYTFTTNGLCLMFSSGNIYVAIGDLLIVTKTGDNYNYMYYPKNGGNLVDNLNTINRDINATCFGTAIGVPDTNYSWFIEHRNSNVTQTSAYQRAIAYSTDLIIYERLKINSSWGDWINVSPSLKLDKSNVVLYNITNEIPLPAGQYYSLTTAIAAVPSALRKIGFEITFESSAGVWETYQFKGVLANWSVLGSWSNDLSLKQDKTDNTLTTTDKTISGAINEINANNFVFNVNLYNNNTNSYLNIYEARQQVPLLYQKKGIILTYLLNNKWVLEQYIGNVWNIYVENIFYKIINNNSISITNHFTANKYLKELYLTGINDDISLYNITFYINNPFGYYGIVIYKNGIEVASNYKQSPYTENILFLSEKNDSGITGYCYIEWGNESINYDNIIINDICLDITKCPAIMDYLSKLSNSLGGVEINLPDKIYAVVGDTLQIFFKSIIKAVNPYNYDILVNCAKGNQFKRYFEYTPTLADVGITPFIIIVKNNSGDILTTKTISLITSNVGVSPASNKNIVCVGDSLTFSGLWCIEANRRLTGSGGTPSGKGLANISFKGKRTVGNTGFFGMGGWTWYNYIIAGGNWWKITVSGVSSISYGATYKDVSNNEFYVLEVNITEGSGYISVRNVSGTATPSGTLTKVSGSGDATITVITATSDEANPFWSNGAIDFTTYANNYCDGQIDAIYMLMGWNGLIPHQTDFTDTKTLIRTFINAYHSQFPNGIFKIMGIQLPSLNGGLSAYGANGGYADMYGMVVSAMNLNKSYQELANEAEYSSFVEYIDVASQFDSENNMPETDKIVNIRASKTEKVGINGVHPATEGYNQIADVVFRNFVANFCQ